MPVHKQDQTRDQPATSKAKVTVNPTDLKQFHTSLLTIHKQCPDCNKRNQNNTDRDAGRSCID